MFKIMTQGSLSWTQELLARYLADDPLAIVREHSENVAGLAVEIAEKCAMSEGDMLFIAEAAMLHDIGVCHVHAPELGLNGSHPYIMHGVVGRELLEQEGYPLHALVCERHTGVGLTRDDIIKQNLPLPHRDMSPQSTAEQIICFADLFYSKKPGRLNERKSIAKARKKLLPFGDAKVVIFDEWLTRFGKGIFM